MHAPLPPSRARYLCTDDLSDGAVGPTPWFGCVLYITGTSWLLFNFSLLTAAAAYPAFPKALLL
jgi:hypothetical protein